MANIQIILKLLQQNNYNAVKNSGRANGKCCTDFKLVVKSPSLRPAVLTAYNSSVS